MSDIEREYETVLAIESSAVSIVLVFCTELADLLIDNAVVAARESCTTTFREVTLPDKESEIEMALDGERVTATDIESSAVTVSEGDLYEEKV